jgi:hypothetical protein
LVLGYFAILKYLSVTLFCPSTDILYLVGSDLIAHHRPP